WAAGSRCAAEAGGPGSGSGSVWAAGGSGASADSGAAVPFDDSAESPPVSITAMRVFTGTVSPSPANSSRTTPDAGEGTSVSTLSVEISTMVSSASIVSPTALAQRVIVPSDTLTPIWGMTTSTSVPVAM